jgi:hypothetical protein
MLKATALLRTVVLVLLVGYLLVEMPITLMLFRGEANAVGAAINVDTVLATVRKVAGVAWLAIGWIALETAAAWARAWAAGRSERKAAATAPPAEGPTGAR